MTTNSPALARLPIVMIALLFGFTALPRVHGNPNVLWAFVGTGTALLLWQILLWGAARRRGQALQVEAAAPVKQHYIQACVQTCLYAYWGFFWIDVEGGRPIYAQLPLILAQWVFLYAFDALLAWSRGRTWRLSSGPTPIVLSTNLFIWFRDDWFVWQFAMVAAGLLGKEFVKWHKEGRLTHVFNPSGFGLAVTAIVLIATGTVDLTWAKALATTIENPPHVFLFLFCLGLVVQHFFAVTLMTMAAAVVMTLINLGYTWSTGVYLFGSTNMPAAAFVGLHLLMTDPSTSPRTNVGRLLFGAGYGLGYVVVFQILGAIGAPELFAKLFPVPVLNLCVQWLDRFAKRGGIGRLNERWQTVLSPRAMNGVHMAVWSSMFAVMFLSGYMGFLRGPHPGDSIAFWKQAFADGKADAGRKLVMVAGSQAVGRESADAYNELGVVAIERKVVASDENVALKSAGHWWRLAAARGSLHACENILLLHLYLGARTSDREPQFAFQRVQAEVRNGQRGLSCFLLGLAHESSMDDRSAAQTYRLCGPDDLFAAKGLARLALRAGRAADAPVVLRLEAAVAAGDGEACYYLAHLCQTGLGGVRDEAKARELLAKACSLGFEPACGGKPVAPLPPFAVPPRKTMVRPAWASAFAP